MAIAVVSLICIIGVLIFVFMKIEKARRGKSVVDYYIKPGLIGGFLGILAVILRAALSMILSILFTKGESFKEIITDVTNVKVVSTVLIAGVLIGIFVAVILQGE